MFRTAAPNCQMWLWRMFFFFCMFRLFFLHFFITFVLLPTKISVGIIPVCFGKISPTGAKAYLWLKVGARFPDWQSRGSVLLLTSLVFISKGKSWCLKGKVDFGYLFRVDAYLYTWIFSPIFPVAAFIYYRQTNLQWYQDVGNFKNTLNLYHFSFW